MTEKLKIANDGWVLVCNAHKALLLRNEGDEVYPNLQVEQVMEAPPNPPTHEQGSDKPPRTIFAGRRSPIEQTDWHTLAKHQFAQEVAETVNQAHQAASSSRSSSSHRRAPLPICAKPCRRRPDAPSFRRSTRISPSIRSTRLSGI